jgi:hypothetical protein
MNMITAKTLYILLKNITIEIVITEESQNGTLQGSQNMICHLNY